LGITSKPWKASTPDFENSERKDALAIKYNDFLTANRAHAGFELGRLGT
jgi:hypothetical protein